MTEPINECNYVISANLIKPTAGNLRQSFLVASIL